MNNFSENIITAIDTIVQSSIKNLKLDRTIQATIVSIIDAFQGIYKVKFQEGEKQAYAIDCSVFYKEGDQVLVKIPENDYSNKFLIEGLSEITTKLNNFIEKNIPFGRLIKYKIFDNTEFKIPLDFLQISQGRAEFFIDFKIKELI